jgi:hypothetical protein
MRQKNLLLPRKVTPGYTQSCASRAKITFANLKLSISEMSPLSRNQRLDLRTCLMAREMHLCRSSSNASRLHRFLQLLQDPSRLKVLQRFQQLNFQKWSGPEVFSTF